MHIQYVALMQFYDGIQKYDEGEICKFLIKCIKKIKYIRSIEFAKVCLIIKRNCL